ncbi:MAG: hypothetical protein KKA79_05050 [Nanoarchaeota archaeon]|nr:hypothetical protein [Nanoarchaeota archaeon]MCG2718883.1 hypothetical protein [Nanoarchaeota archaeon]
MVDYIVKCQICNKKIANNKCKKCGRNVCEDHYDPSTGVCSVCKQGQFYKKE